MDTIKSQKFWKPLLIFIILLITILLTREYFSHKLIENGITIYQTHIYLGIIANVVLIIISYFFMCKNKLLSIAGVKDKKLRKSTLLIFPLIYLVLLNILLLEEINTSHLPLLLIYCISIGFAEEFSIRGSIQSYLIKYLGTSNKSVIWSILASSVFFGLLHLFKFDKGLYGELSQVFFATFIGIMFGVLLVITKSIYPLIIIHTLIDFTGKLDTAGYPVKKHISEPTSLENSILIVLLVLPCLIYALFIIRKRNLTKV
ncbi:CPBP family intramembrane glutamic endopeptidase [Aquimarina sp. I32.4]|uniref:CPBP family intramembrane glutamic endopeptidase n=1 Tax=Aquimarina sp. I32.4 TaxID=2053903 RepID=UPI001E2CA935|nr:CPBP family intramembrane glutamic endopeptidase [Aquimarina sp. I32.4]